MNTYKGITLTPCTRTSPDGSLVAEVRAIIENRDIPGTQIELRGRLQYVKRMLDRYLPQVNKELPR
jgi:hypothetical protein